MLDLTVDLLNDLFEYNDETGDLVRKISVRGSKANAGDIAGYKRTDGYIYTGISGRQYLNHRLVFLMSHGYLPEFLDHINRDRSDNRLRNLRECTRNENQHNRKTSSKSASSVKGVHWNKEFGKWRAQCQINGKRHHVGSFDDIEDAKIAVTDWRKKNHGSFAYDG
tara:strand:+ start:297 stop:794 length:498 start_codon:yes stop_codon:yes gene_type:complete